MIRVFKKNYPIRNVFFILGEGFFIFLSFYFTSWLTLGSNNFVSDPYIWLKILLVTFVCQISLFYNDMYDFAISENYKVMGLRLIQALGFSAIFLSIVYLILPQAIIGTGIFLISISLALLLTGSWRFCYSFILDRGIFNQRIILLGSAELIKKIKLEISNRKDCGYDIVAEVPGDRINNKDYKAQQKKTERVIGEKYEGLSKLVQAYKIDKIIIALEEKRNNFPTNELLKCRMNGIEVIDGINFYEMLTGKLVVSAINPSWLIFSEGFRRSGPHQFMKRSIDLILSFIGIIIFLPLLAVIAILIKLDSKGPIFFQQERFGQNGDIFWMYKFRSMICDAEKECGPVWANNNDSRVTRVGQIIRKWRFDEIPQLLNVLKGEMSFVGPRPEREHFVKELENIIPYYSERHTVKPGITGWAQICYGYGASVEDAIEKLNYDLFYIKNISLFMDLMIVLRTIKIVLFRKGSR